MRCFAHKKLRRMRPSASLTLVLMGGLISTVGCSAESKQVCEHLRELTDASEFYPSRNKDYGRCVKEMNAYLKEDAEGFREMEECLLDAQSIEEAQQCSMR